LIDRRPGKSRFSHWLTVFGWLAIGFILVMTAIAYTVPQTF